MATLVIEVPDDVAVSLESQELEMTRIATEEIALAGYRAGSLSRYQVQRMLGFDNRWETEEWLGGRGAEMQYTAADLELDRVNLDRLLGR